MKFSLEINCGNAAFDEGNGDQISSILRKLIRDDLEHGELTEGEGGPLLDDNGNRVGKWSVS